MTACSAHPGTPSGQAVTALLAAVLETAAALDAAERRWAAGAGLDIEQWRVLAALARAVGPVRADQFRGQSGGETADVLAALGAAGLVETHHGGQGGGVSLTHDGLAVLVRADARRFAWADAVGAGLEPAALRAAAALLTETRKALEKS